MLVSELLSLDIPAKNMIVILGLGCTKRTVNKARRNLGDARQRVDWDSTIKVSKEQHLALDKALQSQHAQKERIDAIRRANVAQKDYDQAVEAELDTIKSFNSAYTRYLSHLELYMVARQESSDDTVGISITKSHVLSAYKETYDLYQFHKTFVAKTKICWIALERGRKSSGKRPQRILEKRKSVFKRMEKADVQQGQTQENNTPVQNDNS
jgi:hypothetical protein